VGSPFLSLSRGEISIPQPPIYISTILLLICGLISSWFIGGYHFYLVIDPPFGFCQTPFSLFTAQNQVTASMLLEFFVAVCYTKLLIAFGYIYGNWGTVLPQILSSKHLLLFNRYF
jgi:hypothetical protein